MNKMSRTLVIGDIHGGLKALVQVLDKANITKDDQLIFLGDFVDGWSESAGVIEYLIALNESQPCIFIKGNHDLWCEEWLRLGVINTTWQVHGGQQTMDSYKKFPHDKWNVHLEFFERMPYYHIDSSNRLFIHAGFTSMHGPVREVNNANCSWDRTLWEMALTMDKRIEKHSIIYPKRLKLFEEIYIGHTPTTNYNVNTPMQGCNVWNVDTGAAFKGALTALDIDTKEYWQSNPVFTFYPNEEGRN